MFTALLVIIYIAFISLGLPDSLLGSAWPVMHMDLGAPLSFAGVISMIVSCGTVVSSLLSTRLIARFGTARVTVVSVAMTAAALLGFVCKYAPCRHTPAAQGMSLSVINISQLPFLAQAL